ncbi:hypothetical protein O181_063164 [Austropuccinia psidii MF-1]|uniref:RNA-binding protein VTS1 n=1 Tax=Austropuccinia psidii MF-1 TaxID=1389203 RepID=A0A9Q3I2A1_9BASI|nr:hypothetical protein [Austropuccinia psidii MF-1]
MTSLAPIRPPSSTSNRSPTPSSQPNSAFRHQHSLSSSTPANQYFGALSPHFGGARSAGGPRQSLDTSKNFTSSVPISPRVPTGNGMRPNSEMLGVSNQQTLSGPSLEAEAIDKWFEDLQSYEATLEEMAAASLDVNFKEELSAIEQWFRVLSEAERTAALYSLLQSSTQVQIRFFITVLQQMARSDPMSALLSPALTGGASMEQQMEAKLAQLSLKSPASPVVRQFARQSLGTSINTPSMEPFLSPNAALFSDSNGFNSSVGSNDAAALLANQRAKLQAKAANRVSAPGQLLGDNNSLKSPKWSNFSGPVEEEGFSRSPSPRPKSTGADLNTSSGHLATSQSALARAVASSSGLESQLSPILGGSWASQVNTPLVPMFSNRDDSSNHTTDATSQGLGDAANRLAKWGAAHQAGASSVSQLNSAPSTTPRPVPEAQPSGIQLDDARKFRRQSKTTLGSATNATGFSGVLSGLGNPNNSLHLTGSPTAKNQNQAPGYPVSSSNNATPNLNSPYQTNNLNPLGQSTASANGPRVGLTSSPALPLPSPLTAQSLLGAQQAAMAAQQNWRNGLSSPNLPVMGPPDASLVNNYNMMNTLAGLNGGVNMNGLANLAAMANINDPSALQNMANLLNMRHQMQQVHNLQALQQQLQQNGMMGAMMGGNPLLSPPSARLGVNFGFPMMSAGNGIPNKRSPGGRSPVGKPSHAPGSGSNPDEELDMKLLSDIPQWLRGLRLHKYTPNFEGCTWQEMVLMSDSDLEGRGVAAVGARRKMLRTFETVRIKKGMALPGDGEQKKSSAAPSINTDDGHCEKNPEPTTIAPTPESDKDPNKN